MRSLTAFFFLYLVACMAHASQSSITEADGQSCMGDDKSRKQTEQVALEAAKRLAVEYTSTHLASETTVENYELKQDIVKAFNAAEVKVLKVLDRKWDDPQVDDCFTIRIKAEVIPSKAGMDKVDNTKSMADPRLPLNVNLWVDQKDAAYSSGESLKIYLQGNKPFYARLLYVQADGTNVQLLPNRFRTKNYFAGSTIFEVPTGEDRFDLTVGPPFGKEKLVLYASTSPLGKIDTQDTGGSVLLVKDKPEEVAVKTRGISISSIESDTVPGSTNTVTKKHNTVAEFAEASVDINTSAGE